MSTYAFATRLLKDIPSIIFDIHITSALLIFPSDATCENEPFSALYVNVVSCDSLVIVINPLSIVSSPVNTLSCPPYTVCPSAVVFVVLVSPSDMVTVTEVEPLIALTLLGLGVPLPACFGTISAIHFASSADAPSANETTAPFPSPRMSSSAEPPPPLSEAVVRSHFEPSHTPVVGLMHLYIKSSYITTSPSAYVLVLS